MTESPARETRIDWRTITALNTVSTLSQIGQFGIGFVVLPLWVSQHGLNAAQLGLFAAAEWAGMLFGMAVAPRLNVLLGHRRVITAGLLASIVGLALMPSSGWPVWVPAAALIGLGMGLRWLGLEPWLYHIAPNDARGRLVGFHETLISIAPILAPVLVRWAGISGEAPFVLGIGFTGLALVPLLWARPAPAEPEALPSHGPEQDRAHRAILAMGVTIALIGGLTEAAYSGLFPIFGAGRQLDAEQMVTLLSAFGLGGLLLQYGIGWLADHRGLRFAALANAGLTALVALIAALPLGYLGLAVAVFVLGGTITAYLTLAIIAATQAGDGDLSLNIRRISMTYTAASVAGPLVAGAAMKNLASEALIWLVAALALGLCGYLLARSGRRVAPLERG